MEKEFNKLKNCSLKNYNVSVRADEFVKIHLDYLHGKIANAEEEATTMQPTLILQKTVTQESHNTDSFTEDYNIESMNKEIILFEMSFTLRMIMTINRSDMSAGEYGNFVENESSRDWLRS